jgi:hypothetical protein
MEKRIARYTHLCVSVLIGLSLMVSVNADAADENPCSKEMASFCTKIAPGTSAMMDCLEKHEQQLSNACRDYEKTMGGARVEMKEEVRTLTEFRKACDSDIAQFCKGVSPEQDGFTTCLKRHEKKLSAACLKGMQDRKAEESRKAK